MSLPGIGAYTAGAVASIAWNKPYAAVDGNVLRVVTRLTADSREISDTKFKNEITAALQEIYPVDKCGIFTQSLMELGAVVCMPNGTPRCTECPLQNLCSACAAGTQPAYPVKKKKAQRRIEEKTVLLMIHAGRLALQKEPRADCLVACGNCRIFREKQIQRKFKSGLKSVESRTVGYKRQSGVPHFHTYRVAYGQLSYRMWKSSPGFGFYVDNRAGFGKGICTADSLQKSVYTKPAIVRNLLTLGGKWSIKFISLLTYIYNRKKIFWRM